MNIIDIVIIAIILFFGIRAYKSGFIMSCLSFLPSISALLVTYIFQPILSDFIRSTQFYTNLKISIGEMLGLSSIISDTAMQAQNEIIRNMQIPEFLKSTLIENNNPVIYGLLDVNSIQEYITGFIASIIVNIACMIILFIVTSIVVKIVIKLLNTFSKLPVISLFNKIGGLLIGLLQGLIIIWVLGIGLTFFYFNPSWKEFFDMLNSSFLGSYMYENNILLFMILRIFN